MTVQPPADHTALHRVLTEIDALSLEMLEVRQLALLGLNRLPGHRPSDPQPSPQVLGPAANPGTALTPRCNRAADEPNHVNQTELLAHLGSTQPAATV
jgi:hypothetical protein